jgi:hypothetical protein
MNEEKPLAANDLIQVNEDGPPHWFRCILVIDEVKSWGVQAFCTIPGSRDRGTSGDAYMRLSFGEFDRLGVKSKFVAVEIPESI